MRIRLGLREDAQADLSVHGGPEKAVYFYPREYYATWEALLGTGPLPPGSFGENITSEGLLESDLNIGGGWAGSQVNTTAFVVTDPSRRPASVREANFVPIEEHLLRLAIRIDSGLAVFTSSRPRPKVSDRGVFRT